MIYKRPVHENHFGVPHYDQKEDWGIPIKNITDARRGTTGSIEEFCVDNKGWISKTEAIVLAEQGHIDNAVVVHPKNENPYLRSRPDSKRSNNFSEMAKS
ncbi:MAG: DUF3892 domain-containing protein [Proteobacteria bacterium]|nr:DUF3892 domain-containing protein [Pseudomonadota bacterium]